MPRRRRYGPYTEGELNAVIDSLVHPLTKRNPVYWIFDGLLHGAVEQDPLITVLKFIAYDSPKLMKDIEQNRLREEKTGNTGEKA